MLKKISDTTIHMLSEREQEASKMLSARIPEYVHAVSDMPNAQNLLYDMPTVIFVSENQKCVENQLGCYDVGSNIIKMSSKLLDENLSDSMDNVFIHECAHFIEQRIAGRTAHDPLFRTICMKCGIAPGFEKAKLTESLAKRSSVLDKVEKLMALSESPFQAEAESALMKARSLMERYAISESNGEEALYWVAVVKNSGRISIEENYLHNLIGRLTGTFSLTVPTDYRRKDLRIYGSLDSVETAVYMWDFIIDMTAKMFCDTPYAHSSSWRRYLSDYQFGFIQGMLAKVMDDTSRALTISSSNNQILYKNITKAKLRHKSYDTDRKMSYAHSSGAIAGINADIPTGRNDCGGSARQITE